MPVYNSRGGTVDVQTERVVGMRLWSEILVYMNTFLSRLRKGARVQQIAGGTSSDVLSVIKRKEIKYGDEAIFTSDEGIVGAPTYGDIAVSRGVTPAYKNAQARLNMIKSPAIPDLAEFQKHLIAGTIKDVPASIKAKVQKYFVPQLEFEAIYALLNGASMGVLNTLAKGGLNASLGIGSGVGAGTPLMCKNWYTVDNGFMTYNATHATWNSDVNSAINTITAAADAITLKILLAIREHLDSIPWNGAHYAGKGYKAVVLCDPVLWYHIDYLLDSKYQAALPRSKDNPTFGVDMVIEYLDMVFVNVPNLKKYRAATNAVTLVPDFGPGINVDPRTYTTSSNVALMTFLGDNALFEGYDGVVKTTHEDGYHTDGQEWGARTKVAHMRGEWYSKDNRVLSVDNVYSPSILQTAFYENGVLNFA